MIGLISSIIHVKETWYKSNLNLRNTVLIVTVYYSLAQVACECSSLVPTRKNWIWVQQLSHSACVPYNWNRLTAENSAQHFSGTPDWLPHVIDNAAVWNHNKSSYTKPGGSAKMFRLTLVTRQPYFSTVCNLGTLWLWNLYTRKSGRGLVFLHWENLE